MNQSITSSSPSSCELCKNSVPDVECNEFAIPFEGPDYMDAHTLTAARSAAEKILAPPTGELSEWRTENEGRTPLCFVAADKGPRTPVSV